MKKNTKKKLKFSLIGGILILLIIGIFYFSTEQAVWNYGWNTEITYSKIYDDYIDITMSWSEQRNIGTTCSQIAPVEVWVHYDSNNVGNSPGIIIATDSTPAMPSWISELQGKKFNVYSASTMNRPFLNLTGYCEFQAVGEWTSNTQYSWFLRPTNCKFQGGIDLTDNVGCTYFPEYSVYSWQHDLSGELKIKFPKTNVECIDNTWCKENKECISGECKVVELPIAYYRFSNNECLLKYLLSSVVTTNDYLTIEECETYIEEVIIPEEEAEAEEEEEIIENQECIQNIDCIDTCGEETPTCQDNLCYCDNIIYEEELEPSLVSKYGTQSLTILIYGIILILILIGAIKLIRKKK